MQGNFIYLFIKARKKFKRAPLMSAASDALDSLSVGYSSILVFFLHFLSKVKFRAVNLDLFLYKNKMLIFIL